MNNPLFSVDIDAIHVGQNISSELSTQTYGYRNIDKYESFNLKPRFIHQVPHLTIEPGAEAVFDVTVESTTPTR